MKLIHTSDWHLGQTLHGFDRQWEHQRFLDWLADTMEAEQADALLVSGDIFDSANPPVAAQRQLYRFLAGARQRLPRLAVILTAGNHDSPARLEAPAAVLEPVGATVVGQVPHSADGIELDRLLVPLPDRSGSIAAWCMAIPFLRPADLPPLPDDAQGDAYLGGVTLLHRLVLERALERRRPGQAIVAMDHCHMSGGQVSHDSERQLVIGGAEALPATIFGPAIAYAALGHLHLAQRVGGADRVRYSGSPLPMSFAEIAYPHQVLVVELEGESLARVRPIRVPRVMDLMRIPAVPAPAEEVLPLLEALELPDAPEEERPLLEVRIRLAAPDPHLRARVEAALAGKPVRLARIETTSGRVAGEIPLTGALSLDDLGSLEPTTVFSGLHRQRYGEDPSAPLLAAFAELLAPCGEGPPG